MKHNKLTINTTYCDMRNITKEYLESYESVTVNAAFLLITPEGQAMLADYEVCLNSTNIILAEKELDFITQNGVYRMQSSSHVPEHRFYLAVNGKVVIEAKTEEILRKCAGIFVNGTLICPESMTHYLSKMQINGKNITYPDGAVVLKHRFVPDKVFVLRAKRQDYFVAGEVLLTDETVDVKKLKEVGVHFITPRAFVAECLLEEAVSLFDDTTDIQLLELDMRYIDEDVTLTKGTLRRYGTKLYVNGNVQIEDMETLQCLEKLVVSDTLCLKEELEQALYEKGDAVIYHELQIRRGIWMTDKVSLKIDKAFLEKYNEVITVSDTASVYIAPDVSKEQVEERLHFRDCALIYCSTKQRSTVEMVCETAAKIICPDSGEEEEIRQKGCKTVNTSYYVF